MSARYLTRGQEACKAADLRRDVVPVDLLSGDSGSYKRPFQNLATAATADPDRAVAALDRAVQAWQKNISFIWWAPALQAVKGDQFETYFGYWAWEAAGLVVARG